MGWVSLSLKDFDLTIMNDEDEYETPRELYKSLCEKYNIFPKLDVCADSNNSKCGLHLEDAFHKDWYYDSWCNPPHSKTEDFVKRANTQWLNHNINILMIVPANSICTHYFEYIVEKVVEIHPIFGRPQFLRYGKISKYPSRNSYFVVIWRKR